MKNLLRSLRDLFLKPAVRIGLGLLAYVNVRLEKHSDVPSKGASRSPRDDFAVSVAQWAEVVACYAMT